MLETRRRTLAKSLLWRFIGIQATSLKEGNIADSRPYVFQAAVRPQPVLIRQYMPGIKASTAIMINDHTAFHIDWMSFLSFCLQGK